MQVTIYTTAEAAEAAFYKALETADFTTMLSVWEHSPTVLCIHPLGTSLQGIEQIRSSWQNILRNNPALRVVCEPIQQRPEQALAIHSVREHITVFGSNPPLQQTMLATNIYRFDGQGWRMILHHSSPQPATPTGMPEATASRPTRLH